MEPLDPSSRWLIRKYIPELSDEDLDLYDGWCGKFVEVGRLIAPSGAAPLPPALANLPGQVQALLQGYANRIGAVQRLQLARRQIAVRKGKYGLTLRAMTGEGFKSVFSYWHYYWTWMRTMPFLIRGRLRYLMRHLV
jgi:hypothetical protein